MSKGAKEFIEDVGKNEKLRHQLYQQSADIVIALAKENGYEFEKHQLQNALYEKLGIHAPIADVDSSNCIVVIVAAAARTR
ncbi:MAG TPA: Nif11-like leader peptide family natural product precursor [Verrucomicrobiae bacterium]|jgi:predicted ribosomally synthesized peptide with nif11-like leader|nr:Nif11-like leader peptide family natural product precursor [Verrucomicrobiae bacterium]